MNMWTFSCLKTARMASSQRIMRLSFGSWRSCSRTYAHIRLTVWGRDSYWVGLASVNCGGNRKGLDDGMSDGMIECIDVLEFRCLKGPRAEPRASWVSTPVLIGMFDAIQEHLTWKPPLLFTFFSTASDPESCRSLSSSAFTLSAVFFFGLRFFFLIVILFRFAPPLVGLARLFSSACSFAAKAASASTKCSTFRFFFGVGEFGTSESSSSSLVRLWP